MSTTMNDPLWTKDDVWAATTAARTRLADLLDSLDDAAWDRPSLCAGWAVRDVVAHLVMGPQFSYRAGLTEMIRARGSFNRMVHDAAVRRSGRPGQELAADLRAVAALRTRPPGTSYLDPLADVLVHTQDIAIPLGRRLPITPCLHAVGGKSAGHRRYQGKIRVNPESVGRTRSSVGRGESRPDRGGGRRQFRKGIGPAVEPVGCNPKFVVGCIPGGAASGSQRGHAGGRVE